MNGRYLWRELAGRKKQTIIVAAGLAVAIALVVVVGALANGVRDAQAAALASVYGVGTDLTLSGAAAGPGEGGGQRFDFGAGDGTTDEDGTTQVSQSRLAVAMGRATLEASAVDTVLGTEGVAAASGALALSNVTFGGELPSPPDDMSAGGDAEGEMPGGAPQGGQGGDFAGGSFDLDQTSVLGVDSASASVGPLSSVSVTEGRALAAADAGALVAVVDEAYATTNEVSVGGTVELAGEEFEVVGIVASASDAADSAADVFIPLDVAQELSGAGDVVSTVYVQARSADDIAAVQTALAEALPEVTVHSETELAETVSGSLSSAAGLVSGLGTWLSAVVLAVAVLLAILFTASGVSRRTREFGTLKALGWTNGRVVRQVAGETLVQGLIGAAAGVVLGLAIAGAIDVIRPTISATTAQPAAPGGGGGPGAMGAGAASSAAAETVLSAPVSIGTVLVAVALAIAGGLLAGMIGGWRAARLSPAEALRAVA